MMAWPQFLQPRQAQAPPSRSTPSGIEGAEQPSTSIANPVTATPSPSNAAVTSTPGNGVSSASTPELKTTLHLSTILIVIDNGSTTFASAHLADLAFTKNAGPESWMSGTGLWTDLSTVGAATVPPSSVTIAFGKASNTQASYFLSSAAISAATSAAKAEELAEQTSSTAESSQVASVTNRHSSGSVAGAAVGGFFGGAILASALLLGFFILRKRKQRRQRRDMQIQSSFDRRISAATRQPFEDIALSSNNEHKPLTTFEPESKSISPEQIITPATTHVATQLRRPSRSVDLNSVHSSAGIVGKRASIAEKRESFPAMLTNTRPRRTISISAAGLVSPVAAIHSGQPSGGIEDIVKQLRMQVSTLFEQIEMHVDNFYQPQKEHQNEPLSETEQVKLHKVETPHLEDSIVGLLPVATDARTLIKHCMAQIVTSRIDYTSRVQSSESLLPESLLATYKLMAASTNDNPSPALDAWRIESVSLLGIENIEKSMSGQLRNLASLVTTAFKPWAVLRYSVEARTSHLSSIFRQAVELGLEVFGTQERTSWLWDKPEADSKIVVFPGLAVEGSRSREAVDGERIEVGVLVLAEL